jgi:hypothetical protein
VLWLTLEGLGRSAASGDDPDPHRFTYHRGLACEEKAMMRARSMVRVKKARVKSN